MSKNDCSEDSPRDLSSAEMLELADFDAEISPLERQQLEAAVSTAERTHQQKLCLIAMSSTSEMLKNLRRESPEEFDAMLDRIDSFQEHVKVLAELSQKAHYRMLVIGCLSEDELST